MEKQKAKKPTIGADYMVRRDDNGEPIWQHHYIDYICHECGLGIAEAYICCPYCGTYIDWSEEKMGISNGKIEAGEFVAKMNHDNVKHPSHYTAGKVECIEAIKESMTKEEYRGYLKGQVMKYIWRYQKKGKPLEDLQKAQQYLEWLIEEVKQDDFMELPIVKAAYEKMGGRNGGENDGQRK